MGAAGVDGCEVETTLWKYQSGGVGWVESERDVFWIRADFCVSS